MPRLSIDIEARLAQFQDGLNRIERDTRSVASRMESAFGGVRSAIAALGVGLSAGAFAAFVKRGIDAADQLNKLSQKVGVTVESLSALQYAAKLSDVSIEQLQTGLTRLNVTLADAQAGGKEAGQAFARLRLDPAQFRSTEQAFEAIAGRLSQMEDGFEKTAIAVQLFGRSGAELLPLLNQGPEGLAKFREEAKRLGLVVSTETARAAEEFNDNLTRLKANLEGLGTTIASKVVGPLRDLTDRLVAAREAGGLLGFIFGEQGGGDVASKIEATTKRLEELRRTREAFDKMGKVQRAFSADDIAILNVQIAAAEKELAYLQKVRKLRDDAGRASLGRQLGGDAIGRERLAKLPGDAATKEAERRAKALAEIEKKAQEDIAAASAKAYALAAEVRINDTRDAIAEEVKATEAAEEEKFRIAKEYAEKHAEIQRVQRDFEEEMHKAEVENILERVDKEREAQLELIRRNEQAARQLGLVFQSAFEDAVVNGEKLRDVLQGLLQDIARIILRKAVTEPIAGAISGIFGQLFGGLFGGGRAGGGPVDPGKFYVVGERGPELLVPRAAANVVPTGAGMGGMTINIDARGADLGVETRLRALVPALVAVTKGSIQDDARRGL